MKMFFRKNILFALFFSLALPTAMQGNIWDWFRWNRVPPAPAVAAPAVAAPAVAAPAVAAPAVAAPAVAAPAVDVQVMAQQLQQAQALAQQVLAQQAQQQAQAAMAYFPLQVVQPPAPVQQPDTGYIWAAWEKMYLFVIAYCVIAAYKGFFPEPTCVVDANPTVAARAATSSIFKNLESITKSITKLTPKTSCWRDWLPFGEGCPSSELEISKNSVLNSLAPVEEIRKNVTEIATIIQNTHLFAKDKTVLQKLINLTQAVAQKTFEGGPITTFLTFAKRNVKEITAMMQTVDWSTQPVIRYVREIENTTSLPQRIVREMFYELPRNFLNNFYTLMTHCSTKEESCWNLMSPARYGQIAFVLNDLRSFIEKIYQSNIDPLFTSEAYRKLVVTRGAVSAAVLGCFNAIYNPTNEESRLPVNTGNGAWLSTDWLVNWKNYAYNKFNNGLNSVSSFSDLWGWSKLQCLYWGYQLYSQIKGVPVEALATTISELCSMNTSGNWAFISSKTAFLTLLLLYHLSHQGKLLYKDWYDNQATNFDLFLALLRRGAGFAGSLSLSAFISDWAFTPPVSA